MASTNPVYASGRTPSSRERRELAHRTGDGLDVTLVWYAAGDDVAVCVEDARSGDRFELTVPKAAALDAFHHPFAYAARRDAPAARRPDAAFAEAA